MKTFFKTLVIFFLIAFFYVFQNEIVSWVGNVYSYLTSDVKAPDGTPLKEKTKIELPSKEDLPGALRVIDSIVTSNDKLSKAGVITYTNKYRKENGDLVQLVENNKLDLSAQKKLQDMFAKQYFEHTSPSGVGISELGNQAGYEYILIGENLAMGNFKNDQALVDAWMASPGHRANILNKHYTEIGVAVGKGVFEGRNVWMAVQHFGAPSNLCSSTDKNLLDEIKLNQGAIQKMENDLTSKKAQIDKKGVYEGTAYIEQVNQYNNLINIYNNLVIDTKVEINNYNNQINIFNSCVVNNQN